MQAQLQSRLERRLSRLLRAELRPTSARINRGGDEFRELLIHKSRFNNMLRERGFPVTDDYLLVHGNGDVTKAHPASVADDLASLPDGRYFAKPLLGFQGRGASAFEKSGADFTGDGKHFTAAELTADLAETAALDPFRQVLVQGRLGKHPDSLDLAPFALGTLRMLVFRPHGSQPRLEHTVLRIGLRGSIVDNYGAGGIAVKVVDGLVHGPGVDKLGNRYDRHPDTGVLLDGIRVPCWGECVALATRAHMLFPGIFSLGWDIALTDRGPVILEQNIAWDFRFHCSVDPDFERTMMRKAIGVLPGAFLRFIRSPLLWRKRWQPTTMQEFHSQLA
jgi:hypothetical protein